MECSSACIMCLLNKQYQRIQTEKDETLKKDFLKTVMNRLANITENDTAPFLSYYFEKLYEDYFKKSLSMTQTKKDFNQLVLDYESNIKSYIKKAQDPLYRSIQYAQLGNYIDFGAMENVSKDSFLELFKKDLKPLNNAVYEQFISDCSNSRTFLLLADNCGEIVLDRFFLEELSHRFPNLSIKVMVKQFEISNDATIDDAIQAKIDQISTIVTTENGIAGCDLNHIGPNAKKEVLEADIIFAKGQANFETLFHSSKNIYYSFLCKCDHFASLFDVKPLTPMFIKENI